MLQILLLQLEFRRWNRARQWSYGNEFGLLDGLTTAGAAVTTLTTPWLKYAPELIGTRSFDQVWIEVCHQPLLFDQWDDRFLSWIHGLAPIRLGMINESLTYLPEEIAETPYLGTLGKSIAVAMDCLTHLVLLDEADATAITAQGNVMALWTPACIPRRFIRNSGPPRSSQEAVFAGSVYPGRQALLTTPELRGLLKHAPAPDHRAFGVCFDAVNLFMSPLFDKVNLKKRMPLVCNLLDYYADHVLLPSARKMQTHCHHLRMLRRMRIRSLTSWLDTLRTGSSVVSLPTYCKFYPGRVFEAMAACVPVISWRPPARPRNGTLFENGKEILLFEDNDVEQIAQHVNRISSDHSFAEALVNNARKKLLARHTSEERVAQILRWIETGREPSFE